MKKLGLGVVLAILTSVGASSAQAQQKRVSPHETISATLGKSKSRVTVVYGRPYSKGPKDDRIRAIWGDLVPYGTPWRLGADEATLLVTQKPLVMGGTTVPAGAHTLFFLPVKGGPSRLIVSNDIGQWGTQYDEKQDLARIDLKNAPIDAAKAASENIVGQLTLAIEKDEAGGAVLSIAWENTRFSLPLSIQE